MPEAVLKAIEVVLEVVEVVPKVVEDVLYMLELVTSVRCVLWVLGGHTLHAAPYSGGNGG